MSKEQLKTGQWRTSSTSNWQLDNYDQEYQDKNKSQDLKDKKSYDTKFCGLDNFGCTCYQNGVT